MPVTPTYPGIYIEEVLASAHTITAAPTSVTVFVGYTHPFKTKPAHYGKAVQIFSETDYEREFGGRFSVGWMADDVGTAVSEFFANGGAVAYVVALQPKWNLIIAGTSSDVLPAILDVPGPVAGAGIRFTGLEPVDAHRRLTVSVSNLQASSGAALDVADLIVTYGTRTETFRRVTLNPSPPAADAENTLEKRLAASGVSLVAVAPLTAYPTEWAARSRRRR